MLASETKVDIIILAPLQAFVESTGVQEGITTVESGRMHSDDIPGEHVCVRVFPEAAKKITADRPSRRIDSPVTTIYHDCRRLRTKASESGGNCIRLESVVRVQKCDILGTSCIQAGIAGARQSTVSLSNEHHTRKLCNDRFWTFVGSVIDDDNFTGGARLPRDAVQSIFKKVGIVESRDHDRDAICAVG